MQQGLSQARDLMRRHVAPDTLVHQGPGLLAGQAPAHLPGQHAAVQRHEQRGGPRANALVGVHELALLGAVPGLQAAGRLEAQQFQACRTTAAPPC